jgi:hypothetical protein
VSAETAGRSTYSPLTSYGEGGRSGVRVSLPMAGVGRAVVSRRAQPLDPSRHYVRLGTRLWILSWSGWFGAGPRSRLQRFAARGGAWPGTEQQRSSGSPAPSMGR